MDFDALLHTLTEDILHPEPFMEEIKNKYPKTFKRILISNISKKRILIHVNNAYKIYEISPTLNFKLITKIKPKDLTQFFIDWAQGELQ